MAKVWMSQVRALHEAYVEADRKAIAEMTAMRHSERPSGPEQDCRALLVKQMEEAFNADRELCDALEQTNGGGVVSVLREHPDFVFDKLVRLGRQDRPVAVPIERAAFELEVGCSTGWVPKNDSPNRFKQEGNQSPDNIHVPRVERIES